VVSFIQQCKSAIIIHTSPSSLVILSPFPPLPLSYPSRSSHHTKLGYLCQTATFQQLSISHLIVYIYWCYFLHSSNFLTPPLCPQVQGSKLHLLHFLHWQADSLLLSQLGSPALPYAPAKTHYCAYTLRKSELKKTYVPQCSEEAMTTTARMWKQPRCPLMDEWIKMMWYTHTHTHIHTVEYYWAIKRTNSNQF